MGEQDTPRIGATPATLANKLYITPMAARRHPLIWRLLPMATDQSRLSPPPGKRDRV